MVTAFLKMISLSSFLLSAFGAVFFFRNHLISERKTVAILATLGLSRKNILRIYLQQNIFLSACAALLAILFALLWGRIFPQVIWHLYQFQLPASIPFKSMLGGFALSILTSIILGMASFISLFRIPPATLLKPLEGRKINRILALSLFFLQGFYFFAIAIGNSRSWMISSLSIGIMLGSLLLLGLFGWTLFQGLWKIRRYFHYGLRLALGNLRLGHEKSLLAFAALGFVTLSLSLIPQLQNLILNEIQSPQGRILPQLFLFDIQEDQAEPFSEFLSEKFKTEKSFHLDPLAPMIRARLEKVNGVNFDRENEAKGSVGKESTEEIRRRQIRNRGFNLSYRDSLSDAEVLVSGKFWEKSGAAGVNKITPPEFSYRESAAQENANLPEISVEKDYAARLNFKLGDHLLFDVQGVEVEGRITSLRKVRWTSFQPNFFVLFEPGALAEAPKTFLATLKGIPLDKLSPLQDEISAAFPNFTCLNLEEVIKKTVTLLNKMAMLIQLLSIFALGIGLTLLWLIVDSLIKENKTTTMLLRTLGETRKRMVFFYTLQFTSFCLSAGMAGYGLSLISVWVVNQFLWQVPWHPSLSIFLTCFIGSLTIGIACSVYAVYRGLNEPLRGLLSQMHN